MTNPIGPQSTEVQPQQFTSLEFEFDSLELGIGSVLSAPISSNADLSESVFSPFTGNISATWNLSVSQSDTYVQVTAGSLVGLNLVGDLAGESDPDYTSTLFAQPRLQVGLKSGDTAVHVGVSNPMKGYLTNDDPNLGVVKDGVDVEAEPLTSNGPLVSDHNINPSLEVSLTHYLESDVSARVSTTYMAESGLVITGLTISKNFQ